MAFDLGYRTPCQVKPWMCKPRRVKFVALDADDTIWDIKPGGIASSITGPLKKIDEDTVEAEEKPYGYGATVTTKPKKKGPLGSEPYTPVRYRKPGWWKTPELWEEEPLPEEEEEQAQLEAIAEELIESVPKKDRPLIRAAQDITGEPVTLVPTEPEKETKKETTPSYEPRKITITLKPGFRDTLSKLLEKDIKCSIISLNTEGSVKRILDAFGLKDKFVQIDDSWKNKGTVFDGQMSKFKVNPCDAMFVDNMQSHVEDVTRHGALGLVFGRDIKEMSQILSYIENNHGG